MTILVAQIIPTSVGSTNTAIEALNLEISGLAALATVQSPVVVVDQYSGYDGDADNQEGGVHPLTSGEKKMAARWEGALFPVLARGVPTALTMIPTTSLTVVATVPTTIPTVRTTILSTPVGTVTPRFGSRTYLIGQAPTRTLAGSVGFTVTGSTGSRTSVSSSAAALTPPIKPFERWYPAARWSAGLR